MEEKIKTICICLFISLSLLTLVQIITDIHPTVKAATIDVGPGQTYTTIQEGIDAADPGDTVYVHAGIYYENGIINKTINLTGENKETTIIDGNAGGISLFIDSTDYVNVSGFSIRNGTNGIFVESSSHCNISNNIVHDNSEHNIYLFSSSHGNIIANNTVYNTSFYGIYLESSSDNFVVDNTVNDTFTGISIRLSNNTVIWNNVVHNISSEGILLIETSNNTIINNLVFYADSAGSTGIGIYRSTNTSINKNIIYNITWYGIFVGESDFNNISNNTCYNNSNFGIVQTLSINNTYTNNTVFNNPWGFDIYKSANTTFSLNDLRNGDYGIWIAKSNYTIFEKCNITNFTYGLYLPLSATNNTFININITEGDYGIYSEGQSNNTIINSSIKDTNLYDFYSNEDSHVVALNTTFLEHKVFFEDYLSNLTIKWYLHVYVSYTNGTPAQDAYIEIQDKNDELIRSCYPDINGYLRWTVITERIQNKTTNITFTPHNISATNTSTTIYASPEPILNYSAQIDLTFVSFEPPKPLDHITITAAGLEKYYIGDSTTYTAIGWNDAGETEVNLTWSPVWSIDNTSVATIDPDTGFLTAIALGSSVVNVTSTAPTGIYATSAFTVEPWPLHHIAINPSGPKTYYIDDVQTYTAIGWNDASETQQNTTWIPVWSVDNDTIASIEASTGYFTALALGSSFVIVTDSIFSGIYNTSVLTIEPWPLHHIVIEPIGPERYYVGDEKTYIAIGWNDAIETQQNMTWAPKWSVDNSSIGTIDPDTGHFEANALGNSEVNVTSAVPTGVHNTSEFVVEPWPLHHISISPSGSVTYYIGDAQSYTAIGWNDASETQMNDTWTPVWDVDAPTIATIEPSTGFFTATNIGGANVRCRSPLIPQVSNISSFSVLPWPLHHIEIIPIGPENYYIGDTRIYTAIGWNDAEETQMNASWVPVWSVENISIASINETGYFAAIALGSSVINISFEGKPEIYSTTAFTVHPWPLHHILVLPKGPESYLIGDTVHYVVEGWNDEAETQMNTTWTPVWSLEGGIQEITSWEGESVRFVARKSGEGLIRCSDSTTGIYDTSEIIVREEPPEGLPVWVWILSVVIPIVICLIIFQLLRKKVQGNK